MLVEERRQSREILFATSARIREHMLETDQNVLDASNVHLSNSLSLYNSFVIVHVIELWMRPWRQIVGYKSVTIVEEL
jgi:hypothetical protein